MKNISRFIFGLFLLTSVSLAAPLAQQQESSISGFVNPNDGSRLSMGTAEYFTNSSLTTPIDVWSDSGKLTDGANPVTVFADGTLWMRLKDEDGVTVYTGLALSYNSVVDFGGLYIDISSTYGVNTAALNSAFADFEGGDDVTFLFNADDYTYTDTKSLASNIKFLLINNATISFSGVFTYAHEEIEIKDTSSLIGSGTFIFDENFIRANINTQILGGSLTVAGSISNAVMYPEWLGAIRSDAVEDTVAIQTSIDLTKTPQLDGKVGVVRLLAGSYLTGSLTYDIGDRITIVGDGSGITTLEHIDGQASSLIDITGGTTGSPAPASPFGGLIGITLKAGTLTTALVYYEGQIDNQVKFYDLQFSGDPVNSENDDVDGISCKDYLNFSMDKVRFDGIGGWAINIRDAQVFSDGFFSLTNFTYDNENTDSGVDDWGKGLFFIDMTGLTTSEKGSINFSNGRIEINDDLTTSKPEKGVLRIEQNSSRSRAQVGLSFMNITADFNAKAKDSQLISLNNDDIRLTIKNVTSFGSYCVYENDDRDSINPIYGHVSSKMFIDTIPYGTDTDAPLNFRQSKVFGMNYTSYDSEATLSSGVFGIGDFAYNRKPENTGGRKGRSFAAKAVQSNRGRSNVTTSNIGTGSVSTGNTSLTVSSLSNTSWVINQSITIIGAGSGGADLTTKINEINYDTNVVTVANAASTTVTGADIDTAQAHMYFVDMVQYGTAPPTTGRHERGDKVLSTNPVITGFIGWVCIFEGTPGTWKTYGVVTP